MNAIRRLDRVLRAAIDGAAAILLLAVTVLGISQVFSRYVLNSSLVRSEELLRLLYVWLILLAAATAPHMRITLLAEQLRGGAALVLSIVRTVFVLALLALLVNGALTLEASFGNDRYVTLGISKSWYWTAAIVGALLWAGTLITGLFSGARPSDAPAEEAR